MLGSCTLTESIDDLAKQFRIFLPEYLTSASQDALRVQLANFQANQEYYADSGDTPELLQGDIWTGMQIRNFATGEIKLVSGIILSNSCDIASDNSRALRPSIVFAPLMSLTEYSGLLETSFESKDRAQAVVHDIRRQVITNVFFLPAKPDGFGDALCRLDDLATHPLDKFLASTSRRRLGRLRQFAHYLFLFKISIHLCRFFEGIERDGTAGGVLAS
jgi:hypothetical protein